MPFIVVVMEGADVVRTRERKERSTPALNTPAHQLEINTRMYQQVVSGSDVERY